jgi:hypothetical protein
MNQTTLKCFSATAQCMVDADAGIVRSVSVLTEGPAKGHGIEIDATTLLQVKKHAEAFPNGVRVKMNHGSGVEAIAGVLKNFCIKGRKLFADLHLLKTGGLYSKLIEMAQTIPGAFGLSISFSNTPETVGGKLCARCMELFSADLVDQPAANPSGLFTALEAATLDGKPTASLAQFYRMDAATRTQFAADGGTLAKSDFDKLTLSAKSKFCVAGGKILDDTPAPANGRALSTLARSFGNS